MVGGQFIKAASVVEATDDDARTLLSIGGATIYKADATPKVETAEATPIVETADAAPKTKTPKGKKTK